MLYMADLFPSFYVTMHAGIADIATIQLYISTGPPLDQVQQPERI